MSLYIITNIFKKKQQQRYKLLVEQLIKHGRDEIAIKELTSCLEIIVTVTNQVNIAVREKQRNDILLELQRTFVDDIQLLKPGRQFIRRDFMRKMCRKGAKRYEVSETK